MISFTKGDTDTVSRTSAGMYESGINVHRETGTHWNGIVCYGLNKEDAEALRDDTLARIVSSGAITSSLKAMLSLHDQMMSKVNHGASAYDAETIQMMNEIPTLARKALILQNKVRGTKC